MKGMELSATYCSWRCWANIQGIGIAKLLRIGTSIMTTSTKAINSINNLLQWNYTHHIRDAQTKKEWIFNAGQVFIRGIESHEEKGDRNLLVANVKSQTPCHAKRQCSRKNVFLVVISPSHRPPAVDALSSSQSAGG